MGGYVDYDGGRMSRGSTAGMKLGRGGGILDKLSRLPHGLIALIVAIAVIGAAMLYSSTITNPVEADLPLKHAQRFALAFVVMIVLALTPLQVWLRVAFPAYIGALVLLVLVELFGTLGGGAQRWLQIGPVAVQPSEFMKLALTMALARYYQMYLGHHSGGFWIHVPALFLIAAPAALIFKQPDLGTTLMLIASGGVIIFLAGLFWRIIIAVGVAGIGLVPLAYFFVLEDYQRKRVETLWNPGADSLGAGYQIEQAKIAVGSGGWDGKGYMQGIQSQLDYIPEQHTDFILTVIAEEFGFLGAAGLLLAWGVVLGWSLYIALRCESHFGRFAVAGATATIMFYIAFNVGMVIGLLPVVGVPMPLVSYGGTAMLTVMACFGLILSGHLHRSDKLSASGVI
ncbi:MAG: rod shape-determining protein RodA [Pseudomonadota bacterium]